MEIKRFVHEWNRMCDEQQDCNDCPVREYGCNPLEVDEEKLDEIVMLIEDWSLNHPEAIYPTFGEIVKHMCGDTNLDKLPWGELYTHRIPKAAAKEFGIMPINECGLGKYVESEWR